MESDIDKLFDTVGRLQGKANVNTAFGEPLVVDEQTLIPVAEVGYGFRMGFGTSDEETTEEGRERGSGVGGLRTRPLGMIEVTPEGIRVEPLVDEQKITMAGTLLIAWIAFWIARTLVLIFGKKNNA